MSELWLHAINVQRIQGCRQTDDAGKSKQNMASKVNLAVDFYRADMTNTSCNNNRNAILETIDSDLSDPSIF